MKLLMRETFVNPPPILTSYDEVHHLEEESVVIPPAMPNLLQDNVEKSKDAVTENEKLTVSCENLEPSTITPAEHESKGNAHDANLTEGESSLDVLNFSTNHAMIEQILVEPSLDLPLSQDDLLDVSCDEDDLHDDIYVIPMQSLKNDHDICVLKSSTCAENRLVIHNASEVDELKLLSSLNTLGYIEFDVPCNLSSLEEKLYAYADLPWFSRHTYHFIGKYNCKGEYMVHRVYICSNLKSPYIVQKYDQPKDCNCYNLVMSSSPSFVIKKHVKFQEGEQCWLLPTTFSSANPKPRTVCCQEGEDDEDMTPSDTTIVYKVSSFLHLHSDFWYNLLGSTCTCRYLNVGTNMSQRASSSKLNFRFIGSSIVLHWEGHNSTIWSVIEVNEHLMESLFDKISNRSGPTSISCQQGLQIIKKLCRCFCRELHHHHELVRHPWDPGPSWSTPQEDREHLRDTQGHPPPWTPP